MQRSGFRRVLYVVGDGESHSPSATTLNRAPEEGVSARQIDEACLRSPGKERELLARYVMFHMEPYQAVAVHSNA